MSQHKPADLVLPPSKRAEAIRRYEERFGEPPLLFILPDDEAQAIAIIEAAIASGEKMTDIEPDGAIY